MKKPQKPSWDDKLSSRLRAMGFESINVSTSVPLYPTAPKSTDRHIPTIEQPAPPIKPETKTFTFQDVQELQNQRMLQENMSFRSLEQAQHTSQHEISQHSANMSVLWGNDVDRNIQVPPVSVNEAISSGIREPKETPTLLQTALRGFLNPDRDHLSPQERIEQNSQIFSAHAKALVKSVGSMADEIRSFGMLNVKRNAEGKLELTSDHTFYNKLSQWADGNLPPVDARVEFVASLANDLVVQTFMMPLFAVAKARPLANRAVANPESFGKQRRAIEALQQHAYRSGVGNPWGEMFPAQPKQLAGRSVSQIRTDWVFPKKGGAMINGRWYTEHALERIAPRTPEVMAELERRFVERAKVASEKLPPEEFRKWHKKNYPNPRGIPPSVVEAEIAKPGSTGARVVLNKQGHIVTVIPGES